jgi:uncharacterized repeat protein (TIGR01451 family)
VTKSFSSPSVTAGGASKTFTVSVKNNGASDADHVNLTDTVDSRLIVDSVANGSFSCPDGDSNAQTITCSLGHLAAGDTQSVIVTYHVASTTNSDSSVSNTGSAVSDEQTTAATGSNTVAIVEDVHLTVTKSFNSPSVTAGGSASSFTVSVSNSGASDADNLSLTDTVDGRLIVDSISGGGFTCGAPSQSISCSLVHLAPGATQSITVTYHVASSTVAAASVNNTASASSDEAGPASGSASVAIVTSADLSLSKSDGVTTVIAGGGATYMFTITVTNLGPSDATSVSLTDTWPAGYTRGAVTPWQGTCTGSPSFTCALGTVAKGQTGTVTVTYTVPSTTTTPQTNTASVSSAATDPVGTNNTASDTNSVAPNTQPVVTITSPTFGSTYAKGSAAINPLTLNATFTDPDAGQNWTWSINWDDNGATTTGSVSSAQPKMITETHSFTSAGVYTIGVTVCDSGVPTLCGSASVWIIVYDPNVGFITGGGWIDVYAGSYTANPGLTGRANFGFNSQYKKGATVPTGQTEFNFQAGDFNFHSENYTWLVVSGYKAQFKGTGTINGSGNYSFTLTAYDGDITGGGGVDRFRIRITDGTGTVIFDNRNGQPTDMDTANPEAISGGSIVIHKA